MSDNIIIAVVFTILFGVVLIDAKQKLKRMNKNRTLCSKARDLENE